MKKHPTTFAIALKIIVFFAVVSVEQSTVNAQGQLDILSISGNSDGSGVARGKWTGQPSHAPNRGKYFDFYVVESQNGNYFWDISGKNFGTTRGGVWILDPVTMTPLKDVSVTISSWSNERIRIIPRGKYTIESTGAYLCVSRSLTLPNRSSSISDTHNAPLIGLIQTRGFGQCTWEVAFQRLKAGKTIPPTAYPSNRINITASYIPQKDDVLFVDSSHTAIITSSPSRSVNNGVTTWTFTVTERNADWKETRSSRTATFAVSGATVRTPIRTIMTKAFNSYWR